MKILIAVLALLSILPVNAQNPYSLNTTEFDFSEADEDLLPLIQLELAEYMKIGTPAIPIGVGIVMTIVGPTIAASTNSDGGLIAGSLIGLTGSYTFTIGIIRQSHKNSARRRLQYLDTKY